MPGIEPTTNIPRRRGLLEDIKPINVRESIATAINEISNVAPSEPNVPFQDSAQWAGGRYPVGGIRELYKRRNFEQAPTPKMSASGIFENNSINEAIQPTPAERVRTGNIPVGGLGDPSFQPTPAEQPPPSAPSIYDNLRNMSDRDFVNFMSREENKNIPGLGWIGDSKMKFDPKTGKSLDPNFKRLVEDPATRKPEKITVDELEARGKYLQGLGVYEHGIGTREQAATTKAATQEYKTMELQRKASADMQGLIEKFGGLADGTIDPSVALYRMGKAGIPLPSSLSPEDSKRFKAAMDEQTKPLRDGLAAAAKKKGSALSNEEIFAITSVFEKTRGFSLQ